MAYSYHQYDSQMIATFLLNFGNEIANRNGTGGENEQIEEESRASVKNDVYFDIYNNRFSDGRCLFFRVDLDRIGSIFDEEWEWKETDRTYGDAELYCEDMTIFLPTNIWQDEYEMVIIPQRVNIRDFINIVHDFYNTTSHNSNLDDTPYTWETFEDNLNETYANGACDNYTPTSGTEMSRANHLGEYIFYDKLVYNERLRGWVLCLKSSRQI